LYHKTCSDVVALEALEARRLEAAQAARERGAGRLGGARRLRRPWPERAPALSKKRVPGGAVGAARSGGAGARSV
jgi:hypothetical protein